MLAELEWSASVSMPWSARRQLLGSLRPVRAAPRSFPVPGSATSLQPRGLRRAILLWPACGSHVVTQHGEDNAWFGQGYGDFIDGVAHGEQHHRNHPSCGSPKPHLEWGVVRTDYVYSPQLIFIGRYETIRMSQQANGSGSATRLRPTSAISPPTPSAIAITRS